LWIPAFAGMTTNKINVDGLLLNRPPRGLVPDFPNQSTAGTMATFEPVCEISTVCTPDNQNLDADSDKAYHSVMSAFSG